MTKGRSGTVIPPRLHHCTDILEFERRGAQHLMTLLGINRVLKPADEDVGAAFDAQGSRYLSAKDTLKRRRCPSTFFKIGPNANANRFRINRRITLPRVERVFPAAIDRKPSPATGRI